MTSHNDPARAVRGRIIFRPWLALLLILAISAVSGCVSNNTSHDAAAAAEARAVEFLTREVPEWPRENGCFSCHNNGDGARALYEAVRNGYRVPANALAATTAWLERPGHWEENKGDPGFSDLRLANVQFAASLLAAIEAGRVKDRRSLRSAARKVVADQHADGAWPIGPRDTLGSPATYGTHLATSLALRIVKAADLPDAGAAIRKAESWLRQAPANSVLEAASLLIAFARDPSDLARRRRVDCLNLIRRARASDGGWGPYPDSPTESFDTAIALLALVELRGEPGVPELIQRGRSSLVALQDSDGGWPETTRPARGKSYAQRVSTTGWATLALLATRR